jgi:hypothetical protein
MRRSSLEMAAPIAIGDDFGSAVEQLLVQETQLAQEALLPKIFLLTSLPQEILIELLETYSFDSIITSQIKATILSLVITRLVVSN